MAKTTRSVTKVKHHGRWEARRPQRKGARADAAQPLTVGELIAAAFDAVGNEVRDVARVLASPSLASALQQRIVLVR